MFRMRSCNCPCPEAVRLPDAQFCNVLRSVAEVGFRAKLGIRRERGQREGRLGNTFSLDPFVHSIREAGHTVMNNGVCYAPTKEEFVNICNTPDLDLLIVLAHGEGNPMTKTDYFEMANGQKSFFSAFNVLRQRKKLALP